MRGNIDNNYEFDEKEAGYVHVRCVQMLHDSVAQEYIPIERIIIIYPHHFDIRKKHGIFMQFKTSEIVHDPRLKEATDNRSELDGLKSDYKLLYDAGAPSETSVNSLKKAINEMSAKRKEEVREAYLEATSNKPGNKSTITLLKELQ